MKCLEKEPSRRYETANGLAMDIRRHLNNEPILARPPSTAYRARKFVRRNQVVVASASGIAAVLVLGTFVSIWLAVLAKRAESQAKDNARTAQAAQEKATASGLWARQNAYAADLKLVGDAVQANKIAAADLLRAHIPRGGDMELRGWEWRYLWAQSRSNGELFCRRSNHVNSVGFTPDGKRLLIGEIRGATALWDLATKQPVQVFEQTASGRSAVISPDGRYTARKGGAVVRLWEASSGRLVRNLDTNADWAPQWLAFSPSGDSLASLCGGPGGTDGTGAVKVWRVPSGELAWDKPVKPGWAWYELAMAFSADGKLLAVGDPVGVIHLFDPVNGSEIRTIRHAHPREISALAFSPDGKLLVSSGGSRESVVKVWKIDGEPELVTPLIGHTEWISCLAFSPDGQVLASASGDGTVRTWDVNTGKSRGPLQQGHRLEVFTVAWARDGKTLVSGGKDGAVYLWAPRPEDPPAISPLLITNVLDFSCAPDGARLAVIRPDRSVALADLTHPAASSPLPLLGSNNTAALFSVDGNRIVAGNEAGRIKVSDWKLGQLVTNFLAHHGPATPLRLVAGGKLLATSGDSVRLWDTDSWSCRGIFPTTNGLDVSPDGELAAVAEPDGNITFRHIPTGRVRGTVLHPDPQWGLVTASKFSPDGKILATSSLDGTVRLSQVPTGSVFPP